MRAFRTFLIGAALALSHVAPVMAQSPPPCRGQDMFEEMKASDPKAAADIRAAADQVPNARALFWRVEAKAAGLASSYLFGTVHLTDERVLKLPPAVRSALDGARKVALELKEMSPTKMALAMMSVKNITNMMMFTSGKGLTEYLTDEELRKVQTVLGKAGVPAASAHLLRPWFVYASVAIPDCEQRRSAAGLAVLDQTIGEAALKAGKPVVGLETVEQQLRAMAELPEETQIQLLKSSLATLDRLDDQLETLTRLYMARDIGVIWPFGMKVVEKAGFSPTMFTPFLRDVVERRNMVMRDGAMPLIDEGGAFIAVGALHLPGKMGLVELLRQAGYTVTAVE